MRADYQVPSRRRADWMMSCRPAVMPEIAKRVRRQPPEIVEFVVEDRLAGAPARRERHDQIMPAAAGSRQHLAPSGEADNLDFQRGFLVDFAMQRRMQRFAEFDPAAGQRIKALGRRSRAPHQQDLVAAKDRRADGKLGMRRLEGGRHGTQWVMM
jgi:hypothetical protein